MQYDVVVVGAGPAGSTTATHIARAGFTVLLVEKRFAVGQPSMCSGLVSPRTLEEAGICNGLVLNEIKGAEIRSTSGRRLSLGGTRVYALVIDRAALDRKLAERAQEAGAQLLLGARLVDVERENEELRLTISQGGGCCVARTRMLIGADGVNSLVSRLSGLYDGNGAVTVMAAEGWLRTAEPDRAEVFVGSSVAPGWFGWIIPLGDGRVRIGTGNGNHSPLSAKEAFNNLLRTFSPQFAGLEIERTWTKAIPVYSSARTYGDNILLVGDAARQVKPTSGGGIYTGLVAARHCAHVAIEALERGDFSESFLARYEAAWKAELGAELEKGIDLRRAFLSLSDKEIDELLTVLGTRLLRRVVGALGDIDAPSLVMEQLVRVAPMLRHFLHVPLCFPSRWAEDLLSVLSANGDHR